MSSIHGKQTYFADSDDSDKQSPENAENNGQNDEQEKGECKGENTDEPPAKRKRIDMGKSDLQFT